MAERVWTKAQSDAITARGGSILVSAAAGSGKTAVLVERALRMLTGENPVPADSLLIVTFSNAAAAEMKTRLGARLSEMIAAEPGNIWLQKQQALLAGAQISTIHSFCLALIRENFQHLDISPDFSLADEQEIDLFEQAAARESIEACYERGEAAFFELVELLTNGRDDRRLVETVLRIYRFSRAHPFYRDWIEEKRAMYDISLPPQETVWGKAILDYAAQSLRYLEKGTRAMLALIESDEALARGYAGAFRADFTQLAACLEAVGAGDWDGAVERLAAFDFMRLGSVRGGGAAKDRAKAARERTKKIVGDLAKKYLNATVPQFRADMDDLRPKIDVLFNLVLDFDERYTALKRQRRRLDFSDLEHLALALLAQRGGDGAVLRTKRAEELAERYTCVMVDEYQDTNEVQDTIFSCVSDRQRNLFMVGDVKQSIYSFRLAMPEIFMRKKQVFFPYETGRFPAKIILDANFRSRETVTGAVNYLFRLLMSEEIGEMRYTQEESLKCGMAYPDYAHAEPELMLLEDEDGVDSEPEAVAQKIADMLERRYQVSDGKGGLRACAPRDFCVLLRSHKRQAEAFVKALTRRGVPARTETSGGYLQSREVSAVLSLLKALDNPLLDVELAAAMLSPLFGFTDDDLAHIRLEKRAVPLYTAVHAAASVGDAKASAFLERFSRMRTRAAMLPADKLLLDIYAITDAEAVFRAMPLGEAREANLRLLVEYAAQYHALGYKRLGGFVGFIARVEERGGDLAPAGLSTDGNSVKVLSVHRSKGLEYPIVILADVFRRFNKTDLMQATQLHTKYGFACVRRDGQTMRQYATVQMQAIRLETERSLLSEELRVLYVALTRAREKLIVSGYVKKGLAKKLAGLADAFDGERLAPVSVREAACYGDWILSALLHHPSAQALREHASLETAVSVDDNPWQINIRQPQGAAESMDTRQKPVWTASPDEALLRYLEARAAYRYPFAAQTAIPAKLAVSAVAERTQRAAHRFSARPKFMLHEGLTAAEKGSAMHKFMQFADYLAARGNLPEEIARMEEAGFLSAQEARNLSVERLQAFFDSDIAKRIFSSEKVYRELKFAVECGQDILGEYITGMDEGAKVVLQGVADCVFLEPDGAVIVDYKTDAVRTPRELAQRYETQLRLYRVILSNSLERPVKQCILYSFHLQRAVEVL